MTKPEEVMNICVYCASAENIDQTYKDAAKDLGRQMVTRGHSLVYGGGKCGHCPKKCVCSKKN